MNGQVVHYCAHGTGGMSQCYRDEMRAHLDSKMVVPAEGTPGSGFYRTERIKYSVLPPRRHTDLRLVTCPKCWMDILALAERHIGRKKASA